MTPTAFIYRAAIKTGRVQLPNGKAVQYTDIDAESVQDTLCWLCAAPTNGRGVPVKKAIKPTFTDAPIARAPESKSLCPACAFCLSYRELRNYSILATHSGLRQPARGEWRGILLDPPEPPFVACIALSGQRWLHIRAQVAYTRDNYPVQVEDVTVYIDRTLLDYVGGLVDQLYRHCTKEEIRTGEYRSDRIRAIGLRRFKELEDGIAPFRSTRIFDLALLTAIREDD